MDQAGTRLDLDHRAPEGENPWDRCRCAVDRRRGDAIGSGWRALAEEAIHDEMAIIQAAARDTRARKKLALEAAGRGIEAGSEEVHSEEKPSSTRMTRARHWKSAAEVAPIRKVY
jgi:hypothetical protein